MTGCATFGVVTSCMRVIQVASVMLYNVCPSFCPGGGGDITPE